MQTCIINILIIVIAETARKSRIFKSLHLNGGSLVKTNLPHYIFKNSHRFMYLLLMYEVGRFITGFNVFVGKSV